MIFDEDVTELEKLSREELVTECLRRKEVCEKIWSGIMVNFGPDGFMKVLSHVNVRSKNVDVNPLDFLQ